MAFTRTSAAVLSWAALLSVAARADDTTPSQTAYSVFNPTPAASLRTFSPDRPTKATGPYTIDAGHFEVESDLGNYSFTSGGRRSTQLFEALDPTVKLGINSFVDLELTTPGLLTDRTSSAVTGRTLSRDTGTGDPTLKAKINVFGDDGGTAAFALVPYLTVPGGDRHFGVGQVQGGLLVPLNLSLPQGFGTTLMTEFDALANVNTPGTHANFVNILDVSHAVPGIETLTATAELYSSVSAEAHTDDVYTFDVALAYLASPNTQLDVGANLGLNRGAPDYQVYSGIAHRF